MCARSARGVGRFGIRREAVRSATSIPSCRSSPWIRGAPHSGLAAAIFRTRAMMSALTGGRPTVGRPESLAQCSRKRRRCQRGTVSGVTITSDRLHPAQTLASPTQKGRRRTKFGPRHRPPVDGELVPQGQVLDCELAVATEEEGEKPKQVEQEGDHELRLCPVRGERSITCPLADFWRGTGRRRSAATSRRGGNCSASCSWGASSSRPGHCNRFRGRMHPWQPSQRVSVR
jgi:hypothetical protein